MNNNKTDIQENKQTNTNKGLTQNELELVRKTIEMCKDSDKIDVDDVLEKMREKEREEMIAKCHSYKIWQSTDGRWRTYIKDDTQPYGRRLIIKSSKKVLEEFLINYYQTHSDGEEKSKITLRSLFPKWIDHKALSVAPTSIIRLKSDWKTFYLISDIIDIPIQKMNKLTLETWALELIHTPDPKTETTDNMTRKKYINVTTIMRQMLWYAVDLGIIDQSPFDSVRIDGRRLFKQEQKKPSDTQIFYSDEEKEIARMAWEDYQNHVKVYDLAPLALLMQFQTGVRIGEVVALKFSDIETPDEIHVQRMLRRDTKEIVNHTKGTSGDRYVILTSEAKELIETARVRQEELGVKSDYIFSIDGEPIPERAVASLYTKYCKKLGIVQKSSHKARKTYVTALLEGGVSINTVREQAGHADEKTTLRNYTYDRSDEEQKRKQFEEALKIK